MFNAPHFELSLVYNKLNSKKPLIGLPQKMKSFKQKHHNSARNKLIGNSPVHNTPKPSHYKNQE